MAEMSMNKAIHGAFRRDLQRFDDALATFPAGDSQRAEQLHAAWVNFDDQLVHHHEGEHEISWPALEAVGVSRELLAQMDTEHELMASALTAARAAMDTLRTTAGADDAKAARVAVQELRTATERHLAHEEAEIDPVYLEKKNTPEIKAMGRKFGQVSPARGGRFFAWVTDGATPDERAAITGTIPTPVFTIITGVFGRGYRRNIAPVWRT